MSVTCFSRWIGGFAMLLGSAPLFSGPLDPCKSFSRHFDEFPYLEQLQGEQHPIIWRDHYFSGCRVLQITHPYLFEKPPLLELLLPEGWYLQQALQGGKRLLLHKDNQHFCLLSVIEDEEWRWLVECAARPPFWPD